LICPPGRKLREAVALRPKERLGAGETAPGFLMCPSGMENTLGRDWPLGDRI
jgi:hypothetical protein